MQLRAPPTRTPPWPATPSRSRRSARRRPKHVPLEHVCEILQARTEEILEMVAVELKRVGYLDRLAAGLVLTGGSSPTARACRSRRDTLGIPARVGRPARHSGLSDLIGTPAFATSIGLVEYALGGGERAAETVSQPPSRCRSAGSSAALPPSGRRLCPSSDQRRSPMLPLEFAPQRPEPSPQPEGTRQ